MRALARERGFARLEVTAAAERAGAAARLLARLRHGGLQAIPYFNEGRAPASVDARRLLPGARSVVCLLWPLPARDEADEPLRPLHGRVARYARGADYHDVIGEALRPLRELLQRAGGRVRAFCDATPLLEREHAVAAGLGSFGYNCCLIAPGLGSHVLLAELVTELVLPPAEPAPGAWPECEGCERCRRACPTGALSAPYWQQTNLCLSFITTELRGSVPRGLRPRLGDRLLGCDACQDACPANRSPAPVPRNNLGGLPAQLALPPLFSLSPGEFDEHFGSSAARRAGRAGLLRNAAVVLGNSGEPAALACLARALDDGDSLVRSHAAWAVGRIGGNEAGRILRLARKREIDHTVLAELELALLESRKPRAALGR